MSTTHRSVSFANKLEYPFDGIAFASGICLGDVDNDGGNELVAASTDGELFIYKGTHPNPWRGPDGQGTYTCVAVGDIRNVGLNSVICVTAEGVCSILEFEAIEIDTVPTSRRASNASSIAMRWDGSSQAAATVQTVPEPSPCLEEAKSWLSQLGQTYTQQIPVNTKVLLLADVDGDGMNELIIGKTDRVVLTYRWSADRGCLEPIWTIEFQQQVGSVTSVSTSLGILLGVAQPDGTMIIIDSAGKKMLESEKFKSSNESPDAKGVETQILGCVRWQAKEMSDSSEGKSGSVEHLMVNAICTSAGLLKVQTMNESIWQLQFDRRLFALRKVDVTGDGFDEIVTCAWDGYTIIADRYQNTLRYDFAREVCTFAAGEYAVNKGVNETSLVYVTLQQPETKECVITIFYDLGVSSVQAINMSTSTSITMLRESRAKLAKVGLQGESIEHLCQSLLKNGPRIRAELERTISRKSENTVISNDNSSSAITTLTNIQ